MLLFKKLPNAVVVPITINNSWKLFKHGNFPIDLGVNVRLKIHEPIEIGTQEPEALAALVERTILADIK